MANSTYLRTGVKKFCQDHLSDKVVDVTAKQCPLLYMFFKMLGRKDPKDINKIGLPNGGVLFSGIPLTSVRREEILASDVYSPLIRASGPASGDSKIMGQRDTMPTRSDWTNKSPLNYVQRPRVKWTERVTPMKVPNKDMDRVSAGAIGGSPDVANSGAQKIYGLWALETETCLQNHLEQWNLDLWGLGSKTEPSNQEAEVWDSIYSIANAAKTDNVYCGVDRTLAANTYWQGNYDTTFTTPSFVAIIDNLNYTKGCAKGGYGIELLVTGPTLFQKFLAEARAIGVLPIYECDDKNLPKIGAVGYEQPLIRYNNTYIIADFNCPSGVVAAFNPKTWTVAINPRKNFKIGEPFDQSKIDGGDDATTNTLRTELMLVCEAPSLNGYYTAIA